MLGIRAAIVGGLLVGTPSNAQDQTARAELSATYITNLPVCETIGLEIDKSQTSNLDKLVRDDLVSLGSNEQEARTIFAMATHKTAQESRVDWTFSEEDIDRYARNGKKFSDFVYERSLPCIEMASDRVFSKVVRIPAGFDLRSAAVAFADSKIYIDGKASWQTDRMRVVGDLLAFVGGCRARLGPARTNKLYSEYARATDPRELKYYQEIYLLGLDMDLGLTLPECNKAIAGFISKLK